MYSANCAEIYHLQLCKCRVSRCPWLVGKVASSEIVPIPRIGGGVVVDPQVTTTSDDTFLTVPRRYIPKYPINQRTRQYNS